MTYRIEHDTMGEIAVPSDKFWGAQTQRSYENFKIGTTMPIEVIRAFAVLKKCAAQVNTQLGILPPEKSELISQVCDEISSGLLDEHFPLKIYQTGSGTQTNMNVNEVIANRGNALSGKILLHPNDDVNRSQSSNDTFPTAMNIAALSFLKKVLIPAVTRLKGELRCKEIAFANIIKTGRTHLQDAVPLTLGQEISGWRSSLEHCIDQLNLSAEGLRELALGGTAVGTGLNAPNGFADLSSQRISSETGIDFVSSPNKFHALSSKDTFAFSHGALKSLAADLMKIANDIRWLSSGPRCGIGELKIPSNEPGSSIMPGKVNPTQCEAVTMVAVKVMGNDAAIGFAASQGNFELNVFMPVILSSWLESAKLLAEACDSFRIHCVRGLEPDLDKIQEYLSSSLMLVTALNPLIGYENAAKIAKNALNEKITLRESAINLGFLTGEEFDHAVNPEKMVGFSDKNIK